MATIHKQLATSIEFGADMCRALGLNPDQVRHLTLSVEPGGLLTLAAEMMPTAEEIAAVIAELKTTVASEWKDY